LSRRVCAVQSLVYGIRSLVPDFVCAGLYLRLSGGLWQTQFNDAFAALVVDELNACGCERAPDGKLRLRRYDAPLLLEINNSGQSKACGSGKLRLRPVDQCAGCSAKRWSHVSTFYVDALRRGAYQCFMLIRESHPRSNSMTIYSVNRPIHGCPLPAGDYQLELTESDYGISQNGDAMILKFLAQVVDGEREGRLFYLKYCLEHSTRPEAEEQGQVDFAKLRRAIGVLAPENTEELHWKTFTVAIGIRERSDTGEIENVIKRYGVERDAKLAA
jgi:hypothetical protein